MNVLEVRGLTVRYGGNAVVDELSFDIAAGGSVGLVGESGSGKSQTALAILGLSPASAEVSGSARFAANELIGAGERTLNNVRAAGIGIVFQDPQQALNPYLTIGRQLRQILLAHGIARGAGAKQRVMQMLERVGLPDPVRQYAAYPHQLSGGMRQRVLIASALIAAPRLLIADEPTTALDVTVQAQILDLLETVRDDTALLLITHDLGIVAGHCERMLVIDRGRLVESGTTPAVFSAPQTERTRALLAAAPRLDNGKPPQTVATDPLLSIEGAAISFPLPKNVTLNAVVDVDLTLRRGETLAVVGESGSGKSSLVRAVLGLTPMASGAVVYAGTPLDGPVEQRPLSVRRDLQLVFQDPAGALNPAMRVRDAIAEPLQVHSSGLSALEMSGQVDAMLHKVGLDPALGARYPHQLSGGQAQRVAIARALILQPKVLVCDEAVAALDGTVQQTILTLLEDIQAETGLAIVFISHDLAVVRSISHRIAVMYLGRLVELADNATLFATPCHPYTRALIDAVPVPDPLAPRRSAPLQGEIPSPLSPPSGCVFRTRCAFAIDRCRDERPAMRDLEGTRVACHRAEEVFQQVARSPAAAESAPH